MNILMVNRDMGVGGGNTFLRNAAAAFRGRGHACYLVSGGGQTVGQQQAAFDEVVTRPLCLPWDARWLARFIRERGIDVVNAHAPAQFGIIARACDRTGAGLVYTLAAPFEARRVSRTLPAADSVMVMNEYQRRYFAGLGVPDDRMWRGYWLMDWDAYAGQSQPWDERPYDALYCSRLSRTKGPLAVAFLDALVGLLPDHPGLRVAIVGDGGFMPQVQAAAKRLDEAAGRPACDIVTDVLDTAPLFGQARVVAGGNYVCIEAIAGGALAIGAGYDGVFGLVTPQNLGDAAEQYFGDHMTLYTGVERTEDRLVGDFSAGLRDALAPAARGTLDDLRDKARSLFRREEAIVPVEREFERAIAVRRGRC